LIIDKLGVVSSKLSTVPECTHENALTDTQGDSHDVSVKCYHPVESQWVNDVYFCGFLAELLGDVFPAISLTLFWSKWPLWRYINNAYLQQCPMDRDDL